jgi:AcrR family transcriptional regulator
MSRPETSEKILEAAIAVIELHGESAIAVRSVARDAGVSYTSIAHFFGDRTGLIEAAQAERYRRTWLTSVPNLALAVAGCRSAEEFRVVLEAVMDGTFLPDRSVFRLARVHAIGNAQDRPGLAAKLVEINDQLQSQFAAILVGPQEKGWIRSDLNLHMVAAWYMGQLDGRVLIELGGRHVDESAWNEISKQAVLGLLMPDLNKQ